MHTPLTFFLEGGEGPKELREKSRNEVQRLRHIKPEPKSLSLPVPHLSAPTGTHQGEAPFSFHVRPPASLLTCPQQPSHHIPRFSFPPLAMSHPPLLVSSSSTPDKPHPFHRPPRMSRSVPPMGDSESDKGTWPSCLTQKHFGLRPNKCRQMYHGVNGWAEPKRKNFKHSEQEKKRKAVRE